LLRTADEFISDEIIVFLAHPALERGSRSATQKRSTKATRAQNQGQLFIGRVCGTACSGNTLEAQAITSSSRP
jgi:hypothetical protein